MTGMSRLFRTGSGLEKADFYNKILKHPPYLANFIIFQLITNTTRGKIMQIKNISNTFNQYQSNIKIPVPNTETNQEKKTTLSSSLESLAYLGQTQINFRGQEVQRMFASYDEFLQKEAKLPNGENFNGIIVFYSDYYSNTEPAIIKYKDGHAIESTAGWNKNGDISTLIKSGHVFQENTETKNNTPQQIFFEDSDPEKTSLSIEYNAQNGLISRIEEKNDLFGVMGIHSFKEDGGFIKRIYSPNGICYVTTRDKIGYTEKYIENSLIQGEYPN